MGFDILYFCPGLYSCQFKMKQIELVMNVICVVLMETRATVAKKYHLPENMLVFEGNRHVLQVRFE